MSYFDIRTPTIKELEEYPHFELTSSADWEPYSLKFMEDESQMNDISLSIQSINVNYDDFHDKIMRNIGATKVTKMQLFVKSEVLAKKWIVGHRVAEDNVKVTTQSLIRNVIHPIERQFRTKAATLRYDQLKCRFYSDTFFSKEKSLLGNSCGQLFVTNFGFSKFVPMKSKSEAPLALQELIQDIGIPEHIHTDGAKEMTVGNWKKTCNEYGIKMSHTEKASPWQNRTEIKIREMKKHARRMMTQANTPIKLWDFCVNYVSHLRNHLARPLAQLQGRTPYELVTGNTPDISELLEFEWYQPIWYYEPSEFPHQNKIIGRWIGIAHRIGQALCFWILPKSGVPIARTTIQAISKADLQTDSIKAMLEEYDQAIEQKLIEEGNISDFTLYREDERPYDLEEDELKEPEQQARDFSEIEHDAFDELLLTEPLLIREGAEERAKIIGRKRDHEGNLVGEYNKNPLLNTRIYLAQFPHGHIMEYSANMIAEAVYDTVNDDGYEEQLFHSIVDHQYNPDMETAPTKFNTKAWRIKIMWQDGSTTWHSLADIKNSFPVQLAEYATENDLDKDAAFRWWIKPTL